MKGHTNECGQGTLLLSNDIKELCFSDDSIGKITRDEFEEFCRGLVSNKSIELLKVQCGTLFGGEIFTMLSPFLEQNCNICYLQVHCTNVYHTTELKIALPWSQGPCQHSTLWGSLYVMKTNFLTKMWRCSSRLSKVIRNWLPSIWEKLWSEGGDWLRWCWQPC